MNAPMQSPVLKRFSDFAEEGRGLEGDKVKMGEIFNKPIIVKAYRIFDSKCVKDKPCLQLQFEMDGETRIVFTNSSVLIRQIKQYESELPFIATIRKVGSYHTFT